MALVFFDFSIILFTSNCVALPFRDTKSFMFFFISLRRLPRGIWHSCFYCCFPVVPPGYVIWWALYSSERKRPWGRAKNKGKMKNASCARATLTRGPHCEHRPCASLCGGGSKAKKTREKRMVTQKGGLWQQSQRQDSERGSGEKKKAKDEWIKPEGKKLIRPKILRAASLDEKHE